MHPAKLKAKERVASAFGHRHGHMWGATQAVTTTPTPTISDPSFPASHSAFKDSDFHGSVSPDSSPSTVAYDASSHSHFSQYSSSLPSRNRTSLLSAASDALGLRKKMGSVSRKKPAYRSLPHASNIMPGVIEINALNNTTITSTTGAHTDHEHEERERLRDAAAQSIGLGPELLPSSKSESRSSTHSLQIPPQPARLPPFPTTLAALRPFTDLSATFPKFTPPSSLLLYALAKQWKPRTIVLTSHSASHKTHVHLFKAAAKDEKELERLEVTQDSVIFVSEDDVGGRGNVVKIAGNDVSSKRSGAFGDENMRAMWFLQITDSAESQRWIAAIKNAVLTQRAVRAGLDIPVRTREGNEPRGDMDVMLSMHLQGILSPHPTKPSIANPSPSPPMVASPSPPPSLHSLKLNIPTSPSPKGIFSGTRPRSPSVEGSPTLTYPPGHSEDSFGAVGSSLLTMLHTKPSIDSTSSPSHSLPLPLSHVPRQGSPAPSLRSTNAPVVITASDLKISKERDMPDPSNVVPEASSSGSLLDSNTLSTPSISHQGALTVSLQPPPRKYKPVATIPTEFSHEQHGMYKQTGGNRSVAGNFGIPSMGSGDVTPREPSPVPPDSGAFSLNSNPCPAEASAPDEHEQATPTPVGSVDSSPTVGVPVPTDRLLRSSAITKRWSRQGIPLPKQLTPPSGPPPSIPSSPEKQHRTSVESGASIPVIYAVDRSPSSSSSNVHSHTRVSLRSGTSSLSPTFWKRASVASTCSVSSKSTFASQGQQFEFHPSLGSVVDKGTSSRPMSLSVVGSSPVAYIGTSKRRSMPPPRPAPNFAPPPAPVQEMTAGPSSIMPTAAPQKSFRYTVAQRAMRLSLTSPKPPPSTALPPRPDEVIHLQGHRRSSSSGTTDFYSTSTSVPSSRPSSALSGNSSSAQLSTSLPRSLSIRQRLRILSTPPTSLPPVPSHSPSTPSAQFSTLDLSDDNDDDPPTPYLQSPQPFGLGEHIITVQNDPSFLQLSSPVTPTIPKPPPRSPFRPVPSPPSTANSLRTPPLELDRDFVSLSPPPRRGSKPHVVPVTRPERLEVERSRSTQREESKLAALSQRGSVVSLGFVTTG